MFNSAASVWIMAMLGICGNILFAADDVFGEFETARKEFQRITTPAMERASLSEFSVVRKLAYFDIIHSRGVADMSKYGLIEEGQRFISSVLEKSPSDQIALGLYLKYLNFDGKHVEACVFYQKNRQNSIFEASEFKRQGNIALLGMCVDYLFLKEQKDVPEHKLENRNSFIFSFDKKQVVDVDFVSWYTLMRANYSDLSVLSPARSYESLDKRARSIGIPLDDKRVAPLEEWDTLIKEYDTYFMLRDKRTPVMAHDKAVAQELSKSEPGNALLKLIAHLDSWDEHLLYIDELIKLKDTPRHYPLLTTLKENGIPVNGTVELASIFYELKMAVTQMTDSGALGKRSIAALDEISAKDCKIIEENSPGIIDAIFALSYYHQGDERSYDKLRKTALRKSPELLDLIDGNLAKWDVLKGEDAKALLEKAQKAIEEKSAPQ